MATKIDVDVLLGDDALEITLKGKVYHIEDVPLEVFLKTKKTDKKDEKTLHKQLAAILGCDLKEIEGIGFRAVGIAINEIRKWIFDVEGLEDIKKVEGKKAGKGTSPKNV